MKILFSHLSIYFKLLPFLFLYLAICLVFATKEPIGDEDRYLWFAENLVNGFYSPPYPDLNLWNGPGYPVFLAVFIFLKVPGLVLILFNAFLLYFSLILSYKTLSVYSSRESSLIFTIALGLYFPMYQMLPVYLTECLTWFLVSLICFLFVKIFKQETLSWKLIILAGVSIACLAMTKVIFGYVILCILFVSLMMMLKPRFRFAAKKALLIFIFSMVLCLPWLIYTYSLTEKIFYWSNSGGMSLYTMSTPYQGEYGDWQSADQLFNNQNHAEFIDSILTLKPLQRDEAYKAAALKNIRNYPGKFFTNWLNNLGRLLFFPSRNAPQTIFAYHAFIPNIFITVFIIISLILCILRFKMVPHVLIILFLFIVIYLFGSSLVSAYRRMFYVTIPFWFIFVSFVLNNIVSIKFKRE